MRPFKDEAWLRFLAIFEHKIIDFKDKLIILLHYQILNEGYTIQSQTDRAPPENESVVFVRNTNKQIDIYYDNHDRTVQIKTSHKFRRDQYIVTLQVINENKPEQVFRTKVTDHFNTDLEICDEHKLYEALTGMLQTVHSRRYSGNFLRMLRAVENPRLPFDRAHRVAPGTGLKHLEHVPERILAGFTRI